MSVQRQESAPPATATRHSLIGVFTRSMLGLRGSADPMHSELMDALGKEEHASGPTAPATLGCARHSAALCLITAMLTIGILIGLSIDTSGGGVNKLGAGVSMEVCELPLSVRPVATCARCTCCSNAATGPHAELHCPACVTCCAHCPRCLLLSEEHADCLESGGKVEAFKGAGRGWYCVPRSYDSSSGKLPDWYNSVLDYNPQWRTCAPEDLPTCDDLKCAPDMANASLIGALPAEARASESPAPHASAPRSAPSPRQRPTPRPRASSGAHGTPDASALAADAEVAALPTDEDSEHGARRSKRARGAPLRPSTS